VSVRSGRRATDPRAEMVGVEGLGNQAHQAKRAPQGQGRCRAQARGHFPPPCGLTEPSSTGRRKRLPRSAHKEITGFPRHGGKSRPYRDGGGGEIVRCFASVRKGDRAFNIDPPASSYAIMRRHAPTAERTMSPARMIVESLTPRPGIREQYRPGRDIKFPARAIRGGSSTSA
jgi:hypothetical protein